jgi:hypothetical protein
LFWSKSELYNALAFWPHKLKVIEFPHKTWKYRIQLPGRYSADGKRKTRYFKTKDEAEKFLSHVEKHGLPKPEAKIVATERHQALLERVLETLGDNPEAHLWHAIEHYRKTVLSVKPITLAEAIQGYLAFRENEGAARRSLQTVRSGLVHKLARHFNPETPLIEITTALMREFLGTHKKGGARRTVYKSANAFFNWARRKEYLAANPLAPVDAKTEVGDFGVNNEFYSVDTFRRTLRIAAGLEPVKDGGKVTPKFVNLLPSFVLGGFAGIRACELVPHTGESEVIRWGDLHFSADIPNVHIRDEVAKQTKATELGRYIDLPHAIEAIQAWLPLLPKNGPFIVTLGDKQLGLLRKQFTEATGIKFIENGFRNSFATYATAFSGESAIGAVARQMGNDAKTARRYYQRNLPSGTGKAWFGCRPFEVVGQTEKAARA